MTVTGTSSTTTTAEPTDVVKELEPVVNPPVSALTDQVQPQQPVEGQLVSTGDSALLPPSKEEDDDDVADQLSKFPSSVLVATKLLIGSWVCTICLLEL